MTDKVRCRTGGLRLNRKGREGRQRNQADVAGGTGRAVSQVSRWEPERLHTKENIFFVEKVTM